LIGNRKKGPILFLKNIASRKKDMRIVDTRGFFVRDEKLQDEVLDIMTGR